MLLSNGVSFLREMSIAGYNLSEKFMAVKNSLSNSDLALLEKLERAITDFIVFSDDATRPTTLLAINGSKHHAKYDGLWKEFVSSGLAEKLGYTYEVIDTSEYATIKGNEEAAVSLTERVANTLGLPKVTNDEINCFSNQSVRKQIFTLFGTLSDSERKDLLEDLSEEFVNK